jgi:hypothetical protein
VKRRRGGPIWRGTRLKIGGFRETIRLFTDRPTLRQLTVKRPRLDAVRACVHA